MIPQHPDEIHDYVMRESDDIFIALRKQYPALNEAIGGENFAEIRDGITPNTYSVVLVVKTLVQCAFLQTQYSDHIIEAHKIIDPSALESFQIIYQMPNCEDKGHTKQLFFKHTFKNRI